LLADDACGAPGLTEILTRETGGDQIHLGECAQLSDIRPHWHVELAAKNLSGAGVDLAEHRRFVAGP
jgi:hypothetical protein